MSSDFLAHQIRTKASNKVPLESYHFIFMTFKDTLAIRNDRRRNQNLSLNEAFMKNRKQIQSLRTRTLSEQMTNDYEKKSHIEKKQTRRQSLTDIEENDNFCKKKEDESPLKEKSTHRRNITSFSETLLELSNQKEETRLAENKENIIEKNSTVCEEREERDVYQEEKNLERSDSACEEPNILQLNSSNEEILNTRKQSPRTRTESEQITNNEKESHIKKKRNNERSPSDFEENNNFVKKKKNKHETENDIEDFCVKLQSLIEESVGEGRKEKNVPVHEEEENPKSSNLVRDKQNEEILKIRRQSPRSRTVSEQNTNNEKKRITEKKRKNERSLTDIEENDNLMKKERDSIENSLKKKNKQPTKSNIEDVCLNICEKLQSLIGGSNQNRKTELTENGQNKSTVCEEVRLKNDAPVCPEEENLVCEKRNIIAQINLINEKILKATRRQSPRSRTEVTNNEEKSNTEKKRKNGRSPTDVEQNHNLMKKKKNKHQAENNVQDLCVKSLMIGESVGERRKEIDVSVHQEEENPESSDPVCEELNEEILKTGGQSPRSKIVSEPNTNNEKKNNAEKKQKNGRSSTKTEEDDNFAKEKKKHQTNNSIKDFCVKLQTLIGESNQNEVTELTENIQEKSTVSEKPERERDAPVYPEEENPEFSNSVCEKQNDLLQYNEDILKNRKQSPRTRTVSKKVTNIEKERKQETDIKENNFVKKKNKCQTEKKSTVGEEQITTPQSKTTFEDVGHVCLEENYPLKKRYSRIRESEKQRELDEFDREEHISSKDISEEEALEESEKEESRGDKSASLSYSSIIEDRTEIPKKIINKNKQRRKLVNKVLTKIDKILSKDKEANSADEVEVKLTVTNSDGEKLSVSLTKKAGSKELSREETSFNEETRLNEETILNEETNLNEETILNEERRQNYEENHQHQDGKNVLDGLTINHFEVPPLHRIEERPCSIPTSEEKERMKHLKIEIKVGRFSKNEDKIIRNNFKKFCLITKLPEDPTPFMDFSRLTLKGINFPSEEKVKFVRFLAQDLPSRTLFSVYKRFQRLNMQEKIKMGRFTEEEDKTIREYMAKNVSKRPFSRLAKILNRERLAILKRHKKLRNLDRKASVKRNYHKGDSQESESDD